MKFDFTGIEAFYSFLNGRLSLEEVMAHPAYQIITSHGHRVGQTIGPLEVQKALDGAQSPFYGTKNLSENLNRIHNLERFLRAQVNAWTILAEEQIHNVLPGVDLSEITIYPVLGYDIGIGLLQAVCMNLNSQRYLDHPQEFLYYLIHESMHVVYENFHPIHPMTEIDTQEKQRAYFGLWVQSEGYAVYVPFRLRIQNNHMNDSDYQAFMSPARLADSIRDYKHVIEVLKTSPVPLPLPGYIELIYGENRVTYRSGCEIIRRIARVEGQAAVAKAFYLDGAAFLDQYEHYLLE